MSKPAQMFTHELNGLKGFSPGMPWVVDKKLDLDSSATAANFLAGRLVYVSTDTANATKYVWKQGAMVVDNTSSTYSAPLPYILFQNYSDFDVVGDDFNIVGSAAGANATTGGVQTSGVMGVCVAQCAEIETTEYTATTYLPGDLLTSASDGKWVKAGTTKQVICGVVSGGIVGNSIQLNQATTGPGPNLLRIVTCFTFAKTA